MVSTANKDSLALKLASKFQFDHWGEFTRHLQDRKKPATLAKLTGGQNSLLWALPRSAFSDQESRLTRLASLHDGSVAAQTKDAEIIEWLKEQSNESTLSMTTLVLAIGVAGALPSLAAVSQPIDWQQTLETVQQIADAGCEHDNRLFTQLANEVRGTLSFQLPELQICAGSWKKAIAAWLSGMEDMLDADGAVEAEYCQLIPLLLASWTRIYLMADKLGYELDDEAQQQWEWFLRFAMRLLRADGTTMLADPSIEYSLDLYQAAISTSTDKEDRAIARQLLPGGNPKKKKTRELDEEGTYSEWAGLGVLQQDWSPKSPRLAVAVHEQSIRVEVCRGIRLFEINGLPDVSVNGKSLQPVDSWDEVASHFDDNIDYIELEIDLQDGVRLQRQLCLIHDDSLVIIADAVCCPATERIDYQNRLTLPNSIFPMQETENNEIYLRKKKICGLLLPLNLSEWKSTTPDDRFVGEDAAEYSGKSVAEDGTITLAQSVMGKTLYAPFVAQLDPVNAVKPRTWRKLTVAETLEIVSDDIARAYRMQIGHQQWVLYKSFEGIGNRTFLGQNHNCDFFIGRFQKDGEAEELLSLEL